MRFSAGCCYETFFTQKCRVRACQPQLCQRGGINPVLTSFRNIDGFGMRAKGLHQSSCHRRGDANSVIGFFCGQFQQTGGCGRSGDSPASAGCMPGPVMGRIDSAPQAGKNFITENDRF